MQLLAAKFNAIATEIDTTLAAIAIARSFTSASSFEFQQQLLSVEQAV